MLWGEHMLCSAATLEMVTTCGRLEMVTTCGRATFTGDDDGCVRCGLDKNRRLRVLDVNWPPIFTYRMHMTNVREADQN